MPALLKISSLQGLRRSAVLGGSQGCLPANTTQQGWLLFEGFWLAGIAVAYWSVHRDAIDTEV